MRKFIYVSPFFFLVILCGRPEVSDETRTFEIVGTCTLPGYAQDVDIVDDFAYIANDQGGLQIVNISQPNSISVVGAYMSEKSVVGVSVRDTFAYLAIAHSQGGMQIINVAEPSEPFYVGEDNWYYGYGLMAPANDTLYVFVAGGYWFVVEDVSDPEYPTFVRRFSEPGNVRDVYVVDSLVYCAFEQMGIKIFNLAKPDSEALVGWVDTPSNARNIFVEETMAYVADGRAGLIIIDISNPENPAIVGSYDTPDYANDVFVLDDQAYIADGEGGIYVVDIGNHQEPSYSGKIKTSYANAVFAKEKFIYVADRDMGLVIITEVQE